ncbi:hypothetical protein I79_003463 [Cricetulus griseus]|uniref:Uncharacterized protein n=1 Tax=Cricetulus griseus TaxID=10029 RepID=G3H015_CRIGR|nr:hypothetical protein I79_003463 [Cricetulus griseus]
MGHLPHRERFPYRSQLCLQHLLGPGSSITCHLHTNGESGTLVTSPCHKGHREFLSKASNALVLLSGPLWFQF